MKLPRRGEKSTRRIKRVRIKATLPERVSYLLDIFVNKAIPKGKCGDSYKGEKLLSLYHNFAIMSITSLTLSSFPLRHKQI